MLSDQDVGRFRAFGFIVLRNCLSEDEVDNLQRAHDRVIAGAPVYNYFAENGTRMLSPFVQADPSFAALIEHPGVTQAMRRIWGTECIYIPGSDPRRYPLAHRRTSGAPDSHPQDRHIPR